MEIKIKENSTEFKFKSNDAVIVQVKRISDKKR